MDKRVYSYENHFIAHVHSPMVLDSDRTNLQKHNGDEMIQKYYGGNLVFEKQDVFEATWLKQPINISFTRFEHQSFITVQQFRTNLQLQKKYRELVNNEYIKTIPQEFITVAYVHCTDYSGFVLVSVADADSSIPAFAACSQLFLLPSDLHELMVSKLRSRYFGWFPTGKLSIGGTLLRVYLTSIDRIDKCLHELINGSAQLYLIDMLKVKGFISGCATSGKINRKQLDEYLHECLELLFSTGFKCKPLQISIESDHSKLYPLVAKTTTLNIRSQDDQKINTLSNRKYTKVQEYKKRGLSISQVAKRMGLAYRTVNELWTNVTSKERVFSYNNWETLVGYSLAYTPEDKKKLKCLDGKRVDTQNPRQAELIERSWFWLEPLTRIQFSDEAKQKIQYMEPYDYYTRKQSETDYSPRETLENIKLLRDYRHLQWMDVAFWSYQTSTLAYIIGETDLQTGFAEVCINRSNSDKNHLGLFFDLCSDIYSTCQRKSERIKEQMISHNRYIPNGILFEHPNCQVYLLSYDTVCSILAKVFPKYTMPKINQSKMNRYAHCFKRATHDVDSMRQYYCTICKQILNNMLSLEGVTKGDYSASRCLDEQTFSSYQVRGVQLPVMW